MKLLIDECIDRRFGLELVGHDVKTVPEMGWASFKDGELLARAQHEFEVFITVDRNLPYQQTLSQFNLAVLILRARTNRVADLKLFVPQILAVLPTIPIGQSATVSIGCSPEDPLHGVASG